MNVRSTRPLTESVPRYTSYPTAPHFHDGIRQDAVRRWIASLTPGDTVSLYLHVPFCDKLCWFCACHTKHTRHYEPVERFLSALRAEVRLVADLLPAGIQVEAIHFGGGSPTMLRPQDFIDLVGLLRTAFNATAGLSLSVEIDPNDMDEPRLDALAFAGLTRASLGVQDFDPAVQKAINRIQSFELTSRVVEGLRARGVDSINLDLLYGLPHQTEASVASTVEQALRLRPDRIALFGYAHVPWFKKHQTMIDEAVLPDADARLSQYERASELIRGAGYVPIGIDHFALPDDSLASAAAQGRLRRNFQGYTDDGCETLIGVGPSSVSRYRQGYAQNVTATAAHEREVSDGRLPIARGIAFTHDDLAVSWLIERLMCDFSFSASELTSLFPEAAAGLLAEADELAGSLPRMLGLADGRYSVPDAYRPLVRVVAARFDRYLPGSSARHSAAI